MFNRWPYHPLPQEQESLTSWLRRIAQGYNLSLDSLQKCILNGDVFDNFELDKNPPLQFLLQLSDKTGIEISRIVFMTLKSYVPFIVDSFIPQEDLFEHYACQFHTLSPAAKRKKINFPNSWMPWVIKDHYTSLRACALCLQNDKVPYIRLFWQLSWLSSCPHHGIMLEEVIFLGLPQYQFFCPKHKQAPEEIKFIDKITQDCLIHGFSNLPNGIRINASIWIRKLRSLLDEVSQPLIVSGVFGGEIIKNAYYSITKKHEGANCRWKPFEEFTLELKTKIFCAASIIVQEMLQGKSYSKWRIKRNTLDTEFLYAQKNNIEDYQSYYPPDLKKLNEHNSRLALLTLLSDNKMTTEEENEFWKKSSHDKILAFLIRQMLIKRKRSAKSIQLIDNDLQELGIPIIHTLND
jgi:TniQ